ncbi:hypothetical protein AK812_SmicGene23211 [Symbiodinium microadriaticum]|uniref:Uncharacterized protein n=1 Tax=Symbiodinium microadriaticum TaxID=2951 RepID=A0A1Q9DHR6_SYMMI|nr:hypothetical protein AK812_SmicGene23211 [Symbiodinium microadriaticum]
MDIVQTSQMNDAQLYFAQVCRCILCSSKAEYPRLTWGISRYFEPAEGLMRRRVGLAASAAVRSGLPRLLCRPYVPFPGQ